MHKVLLVGDGAVGSSFAFSLLQHGGVDDLVIVDIRADHAHGDAIDLEDVTPMMAPAQVHAGTYQDAADATSLLLLRVFRARPMNHAWISSIRTLPF